MMDKKVVINICGQGCVPKPKKPKVYFRLWTGPQSFFNVLASTKGKAILMANLTNEEQFEAVTVHPKTGSGKDAPIDGDVVWASSDEAVATVTSTGPTTAKVAAVAPGVAQITAVFDADMDVGEERHITASGAVNVVAAEAQTAEIDFGAPTPLP